MKKLAIVIVVAAALAFGAMNFHFILMDRDLKVLKKTRLTFQYTFVDGRGNKKYALILNHALLKAGIKALIK